MNYWFLYNLSDGGIYGSPYLGNADEWTNIPEGCDILGPIDASTASTTVIDAFSHPAYYVVQNNELEAVSNIAELQLAEAQNAKNNEINIAFNQALTAGFISSASGASTDYLYNQDAQTDFNELFILMANNALTYPVTVYSSKGDSIPLTQDQLVKLLQDITAFKIGLKNTQHALLTEVAQAKTVDEVNVVVVKF